jgi:hypothetical protein
MGFETRFANRGGLPGIKAMTRRVPRQWTRAA